MISTCGLKEKQEKAMANELDRQHTDTAHRTMVDDDVRGQNSGKKCPFSKRDFNKWCDVQESPLPHTHTQIKIRPTNETQNLN